MGIEKKRIRQIFHVNGHETVVTYYDWELFLENVEYFYRRVYYYPFSIVRDIEKRCEDGEYGTHYPPVPIEDEDKDEPPEQLKAAVALFREACIACKSRSVLENIAFSAPRKKDGTLYNGKKMHLCAVPYVDHMLGFYELVAINKDDTHISLSIVESSAIVFVEEDIWKFPNFDINEPAKSKTLILMGKEDS